MRQDRRVARTRTALIEAFNHLVLARRQKAIRVADIVAKANVGRSTFYEHYRSTDDIRIEALSRPLAALADAAAGLGDLERLEGLLVHFWQNRQRAREHLTGRAGERTTRLLVDMVEQRLGEAEAAIPRRLAAMQLAEAAFAPVRGWLAAEAPCTAAALACTICNAGRALRCSLSPPDG